MWSFPLKYLGYTPNSHFLKHCCAGGGNVTCVVLCTLGAKWFIGWLSGCPRVWRDTRRYDSSWILIGERQWRHLVSASVNGVVEGRSLERQDVRMLGSRKRMCWCHTDLEICITQREICRILRIVFTKRQMDLWRPPSGPGAPEPLLSSTCTSCMNCEYCFGRKGQSTE